MEHDMYTVREQQEAVRRSGKTNMFAVNTVQVIAHESGYHQLVTFIEDVGNEEYLEMAQEAAEFFKHKDELDVDPVPDTITREVQL